MAFHTISEELRLGTDAQTLLRTFSYAREGTESVPREEVFALVELPDHPAGSENIIRAIFDALKEVCFLDQQTDPYERFETALKEVNAVIAEARDRTPNKNIGRINAVIGILSDRDLHLTQAGEAEAYLVRSGSLTTITEGLAGDDLAVDIFVNIASGKVDNHDKLILASERLLRYATKNEIVKIFSPNKEIGLGLEELDEIIVLEGAQTTGVFALDVMTSAAAARASAEPFLPANGQLGDLNKHVQRGLAWVKDKLPAGTHIPGSQGLNVDKNYIILGALVVVILIILSISWSLSADRGSVKLEEVKTVLASVQENIDVAKLRRNIGDKTTAYEKLNEAEMAANDLVKSGLAIEEATAKVEEIKLIRDELDNIRRYSALTPAADFASKKADISLVGLEDFHGRKAAFDASSLYLTALDQIEDPSVLDSTAAVRAGHYFGDRDALTFLTTDGKLLEWRDGAAQIMDTEDAAWKSGVDLGTYATFVYLLDPTNNQIWKYNRQRENYGPATGYNENADLTKAVSLAIDGDLWVLANDNDGDMSNDIIRIRKGEKKALTIKDLPEDTWENPKKIFTNDNLKFLYVLDQNNNRVLRFYKDPPEAGIDNKQLIYNTQYLFEDLTDIRDFWVDSAEQKIFVVDKNKLYEASI
jgi:hypothetical protein